MELASASTPDELKHLLTLNSELTFLLGVVSLLGRGTEDFVFPELFEVLSQQNPNDMKPCEDGLK
jgi:hypothetical protein